MATNFCRQKPYLNSSQNKSRLLQLLLFGRETAKAACEIKTDDTVYQPAESGITSPVQPFQKTWTPKGDIRFEPNRITLFKMKVDPDLYPDDIEDNRLGFPASENRSRKEWSLIRTPKANLLHLTKKSKNSAGFKVEEAKRNVAIMTDWRESFGFGLNEVVRTNVKVPEEPGSGSSQG